MPPPVTTKIAAATLVTSIWAQATGPLPVKGVSVFNNSASVNLFLGYSNAVTTSLYIVKLVAGAYWEMPYFAANDAQGGGWGIWDGSPGGSDVAEVTVYL